MIIEGGGRWGYDPIWNRIEFWPKGEDSYYLEKNRKLLKELKSYPLTEKIEIILI